MSDLAKYEGSELAAWEMMREQAKALVASRLLPRTVDTPEKAIAIIQTGREIGIGPMQALRTIHIIEGKPTLSSELIAGLCLARLPGSTLRVASTSNEECVVKAARSGQPETEFRFSMADARAAGLGGKDNWKKYPAAMLRARCLTAAARAIFPDCTMGLYDPDELGAVTDERGDVVTHAPVALVSQLPRVNPHDDGDDYSDADPDVYARLKERMDSAEELLASCDSYEKVLALSAFIGSKAKQSELTKAIQVAKEARFITPDEHKALSKTWAHIYREIEKEKPPGLRLRFPAPSAVELMTDEPEADAGDDYDRGAQ